MSLLSWVLAVLNWLSNFLINQPGGFNPFRPKEVNILLLFQDMVCLNRMVSRDERDPMNSWVSIIGNIKYKFFYIGGPRIARMVWRDYGRMDAVVYIVDAEALTQEELLGPGEELNAQLWDHFRGPREELNALLSDEAFAVAPFLIYGLTTTGALFQLEERLCYFLGLLNVTVEPVDANARPIEVFLAQVLHAEDILDDFQELSHYIK
ncbi:GTP-binding protein SAR1A-like [Quercus lobata]|uniref:GTP-binding protein SAR1A-like n=1 Tax=Quercus lobata TaxID=97700 RepID=UPI0012483CBE|nr:GTP-binding protein SAR1A-like [Quercus lobata]